MNVSEFNQALAQNPKAALEFVLPNGQAVARHFHVTEVGRVDRSFIDCGGTKRSTSSCMLQLWTAEDSAHRLEPSKLAKIMSLAAPILESDSLPVEVEYGELVASQYGLDHFESVFGKLRFMLVGKQTDCLAKDKCGIEGCSTPDCCTAPEEVASQSAGGSSCGCGSSC